MVVSSIPTTTDINSFFGSCLAAQLIALLQGILNTLLVKNSDGIFKSLAIPSIPIIKCYFCGGAGHTKNECRERKLFIAKEDRVRYNKLFPQPATTTTNTSGDSFASRSVHRQQDVKKTKKNKATNVITRSRKKYNFQVINQYLSQVNEAHQESNTPHVELNNTHHQENSQAPPDTGDVHQEALTVQETTIGVPIYQESNNHPSPFIFTQQQEARVIIPNPATPTATSLSSNTSSCGSPYTMFSQFKKKEDRIIAKPRVPKCSYLVKTRPDNNLPVQNQIVTSLQYQESSTSSHREVPKVIQDTQDKSNIHTSAPYSGSSDRSSTSSSRSTASTSTSTTEISPIRPIFFSSLSTIAQKGMRYLPIIDLHCSETNNNLGGSDANIQNTYQWYVNTSHVIYDQD